jgi:hypothetical protein
VTGAALALDDAVAIASTGDIWLTARDGAGNLTPGKRTVKLKR